MPLGEIVPFRFKHQQEGRRATSAVASMMSQPCLKKERVACL
jgi:hypothetical protein